MVKELDRTIQEKAGEVALKPLASELADTGYKPVDENATYNITLAEDRTVTYQGEDTAAAFTVEEDAYVDDTSKDFDSGDGTKENPFLIMNARQLDNVRKYMGSSTRGDFYYFEIGRNIDLTGYYGETWAEHRVGPKTGAGCRSVGRRIATQIATNSGVTWTDRAIPLPD